MTTLWEHGWYGCARRVESPNFGPRPAGMAPELAVIHSISLPPGRYGTGAVDALFTNQLDWNADPYYQTIRGLEVSSHFVIGRQGLLTQYVSCDARAWHAGRSSWRGRADCNSWSVGIELEGLEGQTFEEAQYDSLAAILGALVEHYPITAVAGHEHVAPGRKHDPGPGFDWVRLRRMTGWPATAYPGHAA